MANDIGTAKSRLGESHPKKHQFSWRPSDGPSEQLPLPQKARSEAETSRLVSHRVHATSAIPSPEITIPPPFEDHTTRAVSLFEQSLDPAPIDENVSCTDMLVGIGAPTAPAKTSDYLLTTRPLNPKRKPRPDRHSGGDFLPVQAATMHPSPSLRQTTPVRLFIASLGNPPPYHTTRHSAGHILLRALHKFTMTLPPLIKEKSSGGGYVSNGEIMTLWQSTSLMNVSGPGFLKGYKTFLSTVDPQTRAAIVLLHDEMETVPGKLSIRRGSSSPRGHNGIKSVQAALQSAGLMATLNQDGRFLKVGVGIGRPTTGSRETDDVSAHVLGQLRTEEERRIEDSVGKLMEILEAEIARIGS